MVPTDTRVRGAGAPGSARDRDRERGAGLLSTSFGVGVFLIFLLFAVQLLINLYATSVVTSATYDAARQLAVHGSQPRTQTEQDAAVDLARNELGRYGRDAHFTWDLADPDLVKLSVHVVNPRLLGPGIDQLVGLDTIDRTVVVRVEEAR